MYQKLSNAQTSHGLATEPNLSNQPDTDVLLDLDLQPTLIENAPELDSLVDQQWFDDNSLLIDADWPDTTFADVSDLSADPAWDEFLLENSPLNPPSVQSSAYFKGQYLVRPAQVSASIPLSIQYQDPSLLFERRKFTAPELKLTGEHAFHILRTYPYMLARQDILPPFIHPSYRQLFGDDTTRPSPLAAALTLAKMLLSGQSASRDLTWGLIRTEQERLLHEVRASITEFALLNSPFT